MIVTKQGPDTAQAGESNFLPQNLNTVIFVNFFLPFYWLNGNFRNHRTDVEIIE